MKNKVDFDKLIEKKFKSKTLQLNDILDEIDLVLQESNQSWLTSKVIPSNLEENPEDPGNAISIANHVNGNVISTDSSAPRSTIPPEPGYKGTQTSRVVPHNIAEVKPGNELHTEVKFTIKVPDLFSMMTNTKSMDVKSEDRKFINDIMQNIGAPTNNWLGRVRALKKYTSALGTAPKTKGKDITQVISSLMMLNVLKKLSYFSQHGGKQFEYIFSPFIHPEAQVIGDESVEVDDVSSPTGKVSLKFLTTAQPNIKVSGENLRTILNKKDNETAYIDYIVVRTFASGLIQFGRIGITNRKEFVNQYYSIMSDYKGQNNLLMRLNQGDQKGIIGKPAVVLYMKEGGETTAPVSDKKMVNPLQGQFYDLLGTKIPVETANNQQDILGKATLPAFIRDLDANLRFPDKLRALLSRLPGYSSLSPDEIKKPENIAKTIIGDYRRKTQEIKRLEKSPSVQKENINEDRQILAEDIFSVSSIWRQIVVESLELGDVEQYNEQQLAVSDSIQKMYVNVLDNLDKLNKNLTLYFATDKGKNEQAGTDAIENAQKIALSVNDIQSSKNKQPFENR